MSEQKKERSPVSIDVMLETGDKFKAAGKYYHIRVMTLKEAMEYSKDNIAIGNPVFIFGDDPYAVEARAKHDKWIQRTITDVSTGEAKTLQDLMDDGWDLVDFKKALRTMADISG